MREDSQYTNHRHPDDTDQNPLVCPLCGSSVSTPDGVCPKCNVEMRRFFPGAAIYSSIIGAFIGFTIGRTLEQKALIALYFGGFGLGFDLIGHFTYTKNRMRRAFLRVAFAAPYGAIAGAFCGSFLAPQLTVILKMTTEDVYFNFGAAGALFCAMAILVITLFTHE